MHRLEKAFKSRSKKRSVPTSSSQITLDESDTDKSLSPLPPLELPTPDPVETVGLFKLSKGDVLNGVDVIAVHGIPGGPYKTWKHENGSMWIRDFLPLDAPIARVMTFGYDPADILRSTSCIEDEAIRLLKGLHGIWNSDEEDKDRKDRGQRPIVFICHGLGGIIIKWALRRGKKIHAFKEILTNTKAIAFLGVPHNGYSTASLEELTAMAKNSAGSTYGEDLKKNSTFLTKLSEECADLLYPLTIHTFYEYYGLIVVDESSARVARVDESSAQLNIRNEEMFPVRETHENLCKFSSAEDQNYKLVGGNIARLIKEVAASTPPSQQQPKRPEYELVNNIYGNPMGFRLRKD